jgi:septum site-determining protein MinC
LQIEPKLEKRVVIKGYRTGIGIFFDEDSPLPELLADLAASLTRSNAFFTGAPVTLHVGARELAYRDFMAIRDLLVERHRLMIAQVHADLSATRQAAERLGLKVSGTPAAQRPPAAERPAEAPAPAVSRAGAEVRLFPGPARPAAEPDAEVSRLPARAAETPEAAPAERAAGETAAAADTLTVRHTLRSGQRVSFPGHVLVLGDVNSGAEIVAEGDIVVFGALRGLAHAGARGNTEAVIIALGIQPPQLRIGSVISRGSGGQARREATPEIARVEGETIVVETFRGRL